MKKTTNFITMGMQKIKDFGEWLLNYIPPKPKWLTKCLSLLKKIKINFEMRNCLFQPTQTKSALKNFAIHYRTKGSNGYDRESFLLNYKQPITNFTLQSKVKLILSCMMEQADLKSGEVIAKRQHFILKQKST